MKRSWILIFGATLAYGQAVVIRTSTLLDGKGYVLKNRELGLCSRIYGQDSWGSAAPGGRIRKRDCSEGHAGVGLGDSVPEPLGFIAFTPECLFYTEGT